MVISLYFHIPFCTKKCPYCHFYVIPNRPAYQQLLSEALALEWRMQQPLMEGRPVTSIYFGGGTPSLFTEIGPLLTQIPRASDCEITIEANPEESSLELFSHFVQLGINRLSLGVQSLDDRSLQTLERIHTAERAKRAIFDAAKAGFKNISLDLMYDLPGQTEESWAFTLDQLRDLPIQHLSLYNLTIEPHTSFHKRKVQLPQPELSLQLLQTALERLASLGLNRYEISAFARPGFESRHNLGYWTGRPFLGFGPSAYSFWEGERFRNVANIHKYARALREGQSPVDFREKLPYPAHLKERLAVGLRVREGVNLATFPLDADTARVIEELKRNNLLAQRGTQLQLTERGMLYYDTVASEMI
ncbi:MAG: radical SAM family heme chaperone HemW [Verrucomicrobia bacterium]|nr:radical SAM family heme chaperone HemW [Verrucomicrobiota bacterium]